MGFSLHLYLSSLMLRFGVVVNRRTRVHPARSWIMPLESRLGGGGGIGSLTEGGAQVQDQVAAEHL